MKPQVAVYIQMCYYFWGCCDVSVFTSTSEKTVRLLHAGQLSAPLIHYFKRTVENKYISLGVTGQKR